MGTSRIQLIEQLSNLLWDKQADTWFPEDQWHKLLEVHCVDDEPLLESVCQFARRVKQAGNGELDLPRTVGDYTLVRFLGKGGMGTVYEAVYKGHAFDGRRAIKLMNLDSNSPGFLERFRKERQLLNLLDHPNIVQIIADGVTEDCRPYFVMQLVDGPEDIDNYCIQKKLRLRERLHLFLTVCSAIAYSHEKGVFHRDLKPSNILVSRDGVVKLIDFGLGESLFIDTNLARPGEGKTGRIILGTPGRMPPEVQKGDELTEASDIYCLGLVLHDILKSMEWVDLRFVRTPGSETGALLDRLIWDALRPDPQDRYPSVAAFSKRVSEILDPSNNLCLDRISLAERALDWVLTNKLVSLTVCALIFSAGFFLVPEPSANNSRTKQETTDSPKQASAEIDKDLENAIADMYRSLLPPDQQTSDTSLDGLAKRVTDLAVAGDKRLRVGLALHQIYAYRTVILNGDVVTAKFTTSSADRAGAVKIAESRRSLIARPVLTRHFSREQAERGYRWLIEIAEEGHLGALSELARLFMSGIEHRKAGLIDDSRAFSPGQSVFRIVPDAKKSFAFAERAAKRNDPVGLYISGVHHYSGIPRTLDQDYSRALNLWEQAARNGSTEAMIALAEHYSSLSRSQAYVWSQIEFRTPVSSWDLWRSAISIFFVGKGQSRIVKSLEMAQASESKDNPSIPPLTHTQILTSQKKAAAFQMQYAKSISKGSKNPWDRP